MSVHWSKPCFCFFFFWRHVPLTALLRPRRLLSDRLGVLLHGGRRRHRHASVHLAVLFRREEAEAVSVLIRAPDGDLGRYDREGRGGGGAQWTSVRHVRRRKTSSRRGALHSLGHFSSDKLQGLFHNAAHTWLWKWKMYGPIFFVKLLLFLFYKEYSLSLFLFYFFVFFCSSGSQTFGSCPVRGKKN